MGAGGSSNTAGANEQQKFERSLRAEGGDDAKPRWSLSRKSSSKKTRIAAYAAADAPQAAPAEASARAAAAEPPSAASEADAEERAQAAEALLFEAMMEEKRERCRQLVRKMSRQAGYNFIVGTDGSKGAHLAFLGAVALRKGSGDVHMWCARRSARRDLRASFGDEAEARALCVRVLFLNGAPRAQI